MFQLTIWSLPPFAAACLAMLAFVRSSKRSDVPGGHALRFLFIALFCWSAPQALETVLVNESAKMMAVQLSYVGIVLTPIAWFQFALTYSQRVLKMSRRVLNIISIIPLLTFALVLTNSWHSLVWSDWEFIRSEGYVGLVTTHGVWFYVHAVYSYGMILIATAILTFALAQYQQHIQSLLAAVCAPLVGAMANLFYLSSFNPSPWLDFTTLGFLIGIVLLDRGILRRGLLHGLPVGRDRVVEQLTDPVLVITYRGVMIDANQSALEHWSTPEQTLLYQDVTSVVDRLPLENLLNPEDLSEVTIRGETYEVASTPLDSTNPKTDVALVFRNVTERRKAEQKLRELKDELERMAHTDALTNLFNRRYFMQRLNEEFERVRRHNSTLSVLIFDLDHFKNINDTYGHDVGDAVLVGVSNVSNQIKRITDVACRLGGEEFALLLPETDKAGAIQLAHRLRRGVEEFPYQELVGKQLAVTASVGVATVTQKSRQPESLLKVADRALYRAKNGGRNMVCYDEEL